MKKNMEEILEKISDSVAIVDSEKNILYANKNFNLMIGLCPGDGPGHKSGHIEDGDYVVIACNAVGVDSDTIDFENLEKIGVDTSNIEIGDGIIAIGKLNDKPGKAVCKLIKQSGYGYIEQLKYTIGETRVLAQINDLERIFKVYINSEKVEMPYQRYNCFCIVLDKIDFHIKFYQARGFSYRDEQIANLLDKKPYKEKNSSKNQNTAIGKNFKDLRPVTECLTQIDDVFAQNADSYEKSQFEINGLDYLVSIYPLKKNQKVDNCLIIFDNIDVIKNLQGTINRINFQKDECNFNNIIGTSNGINENKRIAKKVASSKSTVLLLGESGSGKGVFAKAIHENSNRCNEPFIHVNMAAIPKELIESELFGYTKGSFTGADANGKIGKFEAANNGTIFLDEIGEMDMNTQAKLLTTLQENVVYPVGSVKPVPLNVRVIAATNKDLEKEVEAGRFRADLFFRLNVIAIDIIPLRERKEDIKPLVNFLLPLISSRVEKRVTKVDDEVMDLLYIYDWPGNVRELENLIESSINMTDDEVIKVDDLPKRFLDSINKDFVNSEKIITIQKASYFAEKEIIEQVLKSVNGNKTEAAKKLNIARTSLYNKMKKYGLM